MIYSFTLTGQKSKASYLFATKDAENRFSFLEGEEALPLQEGEQERLVKGAWLRSHSLSGAERLRFAEKYHQYLSDLSKQHSPTIPPTLLINFTNGSSREVIQTLRLRNQAEEAKKSFTLGETVSSAFCLLAFYLISCMYTRKQQTHQEYVLHSVHLPPERREYLAILYEDHDPNGRICSFGAGFHFEESETQLAIRCLFHRRWFGAISPTHLALLSNQLPPNAPSDILCHSLSAKKTTQPEMISHASLNPKQALHWLDNSPKPRAIGALAWHRLPEFYNKALKIQWEGSFALLPLPTSSNASYIPLEFQDSKEKVAVRFFEQSILPNDEILYPIGYSLFWRWADGDAWSPICEMSLPLERNVQKRGQTRNLGFTLRQRSAVWIASLCSVDKTQQKSQFTEHLSSSFTSPVPWNCG